MSSRRGHRKLELYHGGASSSKLEYHLACSNSRQGVASELKHGRARAWSCSIKSEMLHDGDAPRRVCSLSSSIKTLMLVKLLDQERESAR